MKEFIETKLFFHSIADSWSDNFKQPKSNFKILQSYFVVSFLTDILSSYVWSK